MLTLCLPFPPTLNLEGTNVKHNSFPEIEWPNSFPEKYLQLSLYPRVTKIKTIVTMVTYGRFLTHRPMAGQRSAVWRHRGAGVDHMPKFGVKVDVLTGRGGLPVNDSYWLILPETYSNVNPYFLFCISCFYIFLLFSKTTMLHIYIYTSLHAWTRKQSL